MMVCPSQVPQYSLGFHKAKNGQQRTLVDTPQEALEKLGYTSFRPGQEEAISYIIGKRDTGRLGGTTGRWYGSVLGDVAKAKFAITVLYTILKTLFYTLVP